MSISNENYIKEAYRYLDNAKEILSDKAKKQEGYYSDAKYVKMAGHTAYTGLLLAMDAAFGKKGKGRKDIDWYREQLVKKHRKMLPVLLSAYEILHLSMGYDGALNAKVAQAGFEDAEKIIAVLEKDIKPD